MKIDLYSFLKHNTASLSFKINDKLSEQALSNEPSNVIGTKEMGYLYYSNGFRIGYTENTITELGIDFNRTDNAYSLVSADEVIGSVNNHSKMHQVLNMLNEAQIKYRCINLTDHPDYLTFITEGNVCLVFDIYEGVLDKITYLGELKFEDFPLYKPMAN